MERRRATHKEKVRATKLPVSTLLAMLVAGVGVSSALANGVVECPDSRTYTVNADFDEGVLVNVNHDDVADQLQLSEVTEPFPFIWVAASGRGTIVKINTVTGAILGEYLSAPAGRGRNPSRTTVDLDGAVWAGNRDEANGGLGSVVKIALVESGECEDRNTNGTIETSTGLGDIRSWDNLGGVDNNGGVSTAADECIVNYVRVGGDHVRHVSVDANNNVWTAGNFGADNRFELVDGGTGAILASFDVGFGGYGGLVDGNGVIWSTNRGPGAITVLRYDTKNTLTTADDTWSTLNVTNPYGLGIDGFGNIWNSQWTDNQVRKFNPGGGLFAGFPKPSWGANNDRGVAVTGIDDHVWVANSGGSDVSRLDNAGNLVKVIPLGADGVTPTGVAVDAAGKVWATCLTSNTAKRIDPNAGGDGLGAVDLTVDLGAGAGPYNYSDMTGIVILSEAQQGTWTVVQSGPPGTEWFAVSWNDEDCADPHEPDGTSLTVEVRASDTMAGLGGEAYVEVQNGEDLTLLGIVGAFLQVRVTFQGASDPFATPVLCDLTVEAKCAEFLDIKPGSCPNSYNRKNRGVLPVALVGTDNFDVTQVDIPSLRLKLADDLDADGVPPNEGPPGPHSTIDDVATPFEGELCECHEMTGDGIDDLEMKFKSTLLVPELGLNAFNPGELVELCVTGELIDGSTFVACDCIRLVPPGTPPGAVSVQSNVVDPWIAVGPLDLQLDGGGFAAFERTYPQGSVVTLTASPSANGKQFMGWLMSVPSYDGSYGRSAIGDLGRRTVDVTITGETTEVQAVYFGRVAVQSIENGHE